MQPSDGIDIKDIVSGQYSDDITFKKVVEKPHEFNNFVYKGGLLYLLDHGRTALCIPNGRTNGRAVREIVISAAHSLLPHLGASKTMSYLRDHVW